MVLLWDVSFQVIANLSQVLDRQKEKIEKMRIFAHWRVKHTEVKEEVKWWDIKDLFYNWEIFIMHITVWPQLK